MVEVFPFSGFRHFSAGALKSYVFSIKGFWGRSPKSLNKGLIQCPALFVN